VDAPGLAPAPPPSALPAESNSLESTKTVRKLRKYKDMGMDLLKKTPKEDEKIIEKPKTPVTRKRSSSANIKFGTVRELKTKEPAALPAASGSPSPVKRRPMITPPTRALPPPPSPTKN